MNTHFVPQLVTGLVLLMLVSACHFVAPAQLNRANQADSKTHNEHEMQIIPGQLTIKYVVGNLTLPTETGAVYLTILNGTNEDETLLGVDVDGCTATEIHEVLMNNEVMTMRPIADGKLLIPAGKAVSLRQGGVHIMCIGKEKEFKAEDQVSLTLNFSIAGSKNVVINVHSIEELGTMDSGHQ